MNSGRSDTLRREPGTSFWIGVLVGVGIVFGVILRVAFIGDREVFRDEGASWIAATASLPDMLARVAHEAYPPLYTLVLKLWMGLFGDGIAAMRLLSTLAGMVTVIVGWRWVHEGQGSKAGLVALAILGLSPLAIAESRDTRMYAMETAFVVTAWWLSWRLAVGRPRGHWVLVQAGILAVAVGGELWTSAYGIPTAGLQFLALAWVARSGTPGNSRLALVAVVAGGLSFVPWLPNIVGLTSGQATFWTGRPEANSLIDTYSLWLTDGFGIAALIIGHLAAIGAVAGLWLAGRSIDPSAATATRHYRLFALLSLAIVPIVWLGSQVHPAYDTRYFSAVLPALAGGLGVLAVRALHAAGSRTPRIGYGWLGLPLALLMVGVAVSSVAQRTADPTISPTKATALVLAAQMRAGDVVIATDPRSYFALAYEAERSTDPIRLPGPVLCWDSGRQPFYLGGALIPPSKKVRAGTGLASQLSQLVPGGRIWLVALANGANKDLGFAPLNDGQVRQLSRIVVNRDHEPGQIRELLLAP